ncbi:MAG TPA: acylphosphatase [Syntrophales bacterium]|nr:acylphosphatase [Syntrophales bacterium]HOX94878.1 acylphosphatase [Syntrophales bacterium]HPI55857.1 acylphosphatase [Syntrophales bacterium]HPN23652.1 acylphosphatase [Syntrophales bacterium]HQM27823.1 acylphosphatase [Syntrophales bacterium]
MRRLHVYISGQVQGVAFRARTRQEAARLGLGGWVRNLPDGRVEAVFEGPDEKVEEMLRWCRQGPGLARVKGVEASEEPYEGAFRDFLIRY